MEEVRSRGLDEVEIIEPEKEELRKIICQTLDINEMYDDEEIFEMLRELWKTIKYISKR
jgi:predicted HAD superfamily phosphohydrolase